MNDRLEQFLAKFSDNPTSWSQATDELPELYNWISKNGRRFPSVGRDNCNTPAQWNQKYKAAIRSGFSQLDDKAKNEMFGYFAEWFAIETVCNLCGLSLHIGEGDCARASGLVQASVDGGYESTPGNGSGALDDTLNYEFSMCEFCLDWLFGQFVVPVRVTDYMTGELQPAWKPAAERVAEDDWRKVKEKFADMAARRVAARQARR